MRTAYWEKTDEKGTISIPLPGISKDVVSVEIKGNTIHIEVSAEDNPFVLDLRREYSIPPVCDKEKITSELRDGILFIDMPFKPDYLRQIEVQ